MKAVLTKLSLAALWLGALGLILWGIWKGTHAVGHSVALSYYQGAVRKKSSGNLDGAISDYNRALAFDPKLARAYNDRGLAKAAKGQWDEAIADYTRCVEIDPKEFRAYYNRALAREEKHDEDGAIADFGHVIEIDPKQPFAYNGRGIVKISKYDLDGAIADFSRATEIDPKFTLSSINRARAKKFNGDPHGALVDVERALEINPNDHLAYCVRSYIRTDLGDLDAALQDANQAIALNSKTPATYSARARVKEASGDLDGAIFDHTTAIGVDPEVAGGYVLRGNAEYLDRRWANALQDYRKSFQHTKHDHDQDYPRLYSWLIHQRLKEQEESDKELAGYLVERRRTRPDDRVSKMAEFLLGRVSEGELFAATHAPQPRKESGQLCEAWYFAGMKKLLDGDATGATGYFQKCVATEQKDFVEYGFARAELKALATPPVPERFELRPPAPKHR